jgi:hypothetical protein
VPTGTDGQVTDGVHVGEQLGGRPGDGRQAQRVEVLDEGVGVEHVAVGEAEVRPEGRPPRREVPVVGDALGQVRLEATVGAHRHQRVVERVGHLDAAVVPGVARRVEAVGVALEPEHEVAARLGQRRFRDLHTIGRGAGADAAATPRQ